MKKYFFVVTFLLITNIASAGDGSTIQDKIQAEFGSCYRTFQTQLGICNPSTCNYPDFSSAKTWRAHAIRGIQNGKCYVIYYSYLGSSVIGTPQHCFYGKDDLDKLSQLYSTLFTTQSALAMADAKDQINQLNSNLCQVSDKK